MMTVQCATEMRGAAKSQPATAWKTFSEERKEYLLFIFSLVTPETFYY